MWTILFSLFLCLPFVTGRELPEQGKQDSLQMLVDGYYTLSVLSISDNGKWVTARKWYPMNNDTVLIINSRSPEKPAGYRTKVQSLVSLSNNNLLIQRPQKAELLNPEEPTGICFKNVKWSRPLSMNSQFLLYYNEEEKNRLELRDCNGKFLNALDNVTRFYVTEGSNIYSIVESDHNEYEIYYLLDGKQQKIYNTGRKIVSLETYPGEQALGIYEQNPASDTQEGLYLDLTTRECYPLKDLLPLTFKKGSGKVIGNEGVCFLHLQVQKEEKGNPVVDIWYGNDNRLEEKFFPGNHNFYYVWEPKNRKIWPIGNDSLTACININNNRYFLCFDPDLLQDYTIFRTPLQVAVYDRVQDSYSALDTITEDMYISGNGEYALSSVKSKWSLYHIPSGSKKPIQSGNIEKPWFTDDGNTVLFEGEGTLWKYDPENDHLSEVITFRGYQTSIVNGSREEISSPKGQFRRDHVCLTEPVVIKLSDPKENITSYVLWHKGITEIIVAPTSRRVQWLVWNNSYDQFSWVEEDYNLPPRVVYKKRGEKELGLYQSNKHDKAILSLRQEIVSYSNSEGSPLNGILYYPLHYDPLKIYPMVVHIYEVQRKRSNHYPASTYGSVNSDGFDLRLLLEKGYFVYLPDIVYGPEGTGLSALDCMHRGLDALDKISSIDRNKIGLIGHSHGGYQTNFIATHSNRFAAYVSGAGNSDIVRSYFSFNYNFTSPFYFQFENGQYRMKKKFSEDKHLYFRNNPIHYVDQVNAPILLWAGMKDKNIDWNQTMEFYIGLKRNNKKVISLFYPDEGHAIIDSRTSKDLSLKILDWFDYFLKDERDSEWIRKGFH